MAVDSFLICCGQFYFSTQSDDFAKAIAFALRPFLPIFKLSHFSNIRSFLKKLFAQNNYIIAVDSFLIRFREFYFLTQSNDFAKAILLCMEAIFPHIKILSFFEY